jgi:hypothetical protein
MACPPAQHVDSDRVAVPLIRAPASPDRVACDLPAALANSRAARHFAGASLASGLLAVASAALFYRSAGSSGSLLIAAADCLLLAVLLQVFARRSLRREIVAHGLRQGLDEATAREHARATIATCLRRPRA